MPEFLALIATETRANICCRTSALRHIKCPELVASGMAINKADKELEWIGNPEVHFESFLSTTSQTNADEIDQRQYMAG